MPTGFDNILKRMASQDVILPIFENQLRLIEDPYYGRGDGYFHPSTHPLMDERLLYYMFHPKTAHLMQEERFSVTRELTVGVGHSLHDQVQRMMVKTGLVKPENVEKEFFIPDHHVRGRIDMIVDHPTHGPLVVEIKSRTHYKFAKTTELLPEWDAQLSIQLDSQGLEHGVVLMVETGYPFRMKELQATRNEALLSQIYAKFDRVREAIALDRTPPPCCAPNDKRVSSCPAAFVCWKNPAGSPA